MIAKSITIKARGGRSGRRVAKAVVLTSGGLPGVLESGLNVSQGVLIAVQESAAGVLGRRNARRPKRRGAASKPENSTWESSRKRNASLTAEVRVKPG
jgi:hypothetical protein